MSKQELRLVGMSKQDLRLEIRNLQKDFAAADLRDAADLLDHWDLERAGLKLVLARQRIEELVLQRAQDGSAKTRPRRRTRKAPKRAKDGDTRCPDCGKWFIHERAYRVHRGRMHKEKAAT